MSFGRPEHVGADIQEAKKARPEYDLASWANPPRLNCRVPELFSGFPHRWSHNLLVLRTSPESQSADQNSHDQHRFQ
jgi:hypothetical protein